LIVRRLWCYLIGYIRVSIEGDYQEKFLNLLLAKGFYFWNVQKNGKTMYLNTAARNYYIMSKAAKALNCRIHIEGKFGLAFLFYSLKKRKMLVIGAVLFCLMLCVLSSFVWFIEIDGIKTVDKQRILASCEQMGLKPGVIKYSFDPEKIEKGLIKNFDELAWVGVNVNGTKVTINVVEKVVVEADDKLPCDLIANKQGVIKEIIVLAGRPMVQEGDVVKKGQLLIKGVEYKEIINETKEEKDEPKETIVEGKRLQAKGIIKASVYYEGYGEALLIDYNIKRTGNSQREFAIKFNDKIIYLNKVDHLPYQFVEREVITKKLFQWRNTGLTVEAINTIYHEVDKQKVTYSLAEAKQIAADKVWNVLKQKIPSNAQILRRDVLQIKDQHNRIVRVKMVVETLEEIGEVRKINS